MSINAQTPIFFETSCLVAAAGSPTGGSTFLLSLCQRGFLNLFVSAPVLLEAQRNVLEQLGAEALDRFHRLVMVTPLSVVPLSQQQLDRYQGAVNDKDLHVLAGAKAAQAPYLLTLDQPLIREVNQADLAVTALKPGDFIQRVLTTHPDYTRLR